MARPSMTNTKYILDGKTPVLCDDVLKWATFFEKASNRIVCKTEIGNAIVSTVFLGLDHSWGGGPPLLFETMVFGGSFDGPFKGHCYSFIKH